MGLELPWLALTVGLAPPDDPRAYDGPLAAPSAIASTPTMAGEQGSEPPIRESVEPEPAAVREPKSEPKPKPWRVGGAIDLAYLLNTNYPTNHLYRGMTPAPRTGEVALNVVSVYIDHEPIEGRPWRLEIAAQAGAGVDALMAAEPVPGGDDGRFAGAEVFKHVGLANVGLRTKSGTELDAGLMSSPIGMEWFWSYRNWNHSASWLANGTPFYLMGARVGQQVPGNVNVFGWVVNGWQTIADVNSVPSYLVGFNWAPKKNLAAATMVYFGPEDRDIAPVAWRVHSDTFVAYDGPRWGLGAVWDFGRERLTHEPGDPVAWWTGGGLFFRGSLLERKRLTVEVAGRPEAWWDRDGRIFGVDQWLISGTGTLSFRIYDVVLLRTEYRYDRSTAQRGFFYRGDAISDDSFRLAQDQHTIMFNVVGYFSHRFGSKR